MTPPIPPYEPYPNDPIPQGGDETLELRQYEPAELADEILLASVNGVGPLTAERLLERFGSASGVLRASIGELMQVERVGRNLAEKIVNASQEVDALAIVRFCEENGIVVLTPRDSRYPSRLREIEKPPRLLYVRGEIRPEDRRAISIVGTRSATPYGLEQTARLACGLVEAGFTIISGLALGIDGCAHRTALDAKGRTLAVLGGGVARIYPREHEDLAARVMNSGALISEYHPLTTPLAGNFPARNRIVSGLSIGTLVVESGKKGGSMITALLAAEQNRDLYAVPGPVTSPASQGCHDLIRDGAILVETVDDILNSLPSYERQREPSILQDELDRFAQGTVGITESSVASIARPPKAPNPKTKSATKQSKESLLSEADPAKDQRAPIEAAATNPPVERAPLPPLTDLERTIVELVGDAVLSVDELIRTLKLPASRVLGTITALEFKQVLRRCAGNAVTRK